MENEEVEYDFDEAICANISNLTGALSSLEEIDPILMGIDERQLKRLRRKIFTAICCYAEGLPVPQTED